MLMIDSEPEIGTRITILLPTRADAQPDDPRPVAGPHAGDGAAPAGSPPAEPLAISRRR